MIKSILDSMKKMNNVAIDDDSFDEDIIMHINGVFSTLQQIGVGPDDGFMIEDKTVEWDAFWPNTVIVNQVKLYMANEIRILFDPPASSFGLEALKEQTAEKKWRLQVAAEDERLSANA